MEIINKNDLPTLLNTNNDPNDELWSFDAIIGHKWIKNTPYVHILWTNHEKTWEPLSTIRKDDPKTCIADGKNNEGIVPLP